MAVEDNHFSNRKSGNGRKTVVGSEGQYLCGVQGSAQINKTELVGDAELENTIAGEEGGRRTVFIRERRRHEEWIR